jgi:uncharacterized protein YprB with RNaseH-like and TPR domain
MLTSSFIFVRGVTEDQERALWSHGILDWNLARQHPDEVGAVLGAVRAQKLAEQVHQAQEALARCDHAWFRANWPERETWRLWAGYCGREQAALVDIETTGLTPGFDSITVIGLADAVGSARAFVAGRPQPGDEALDRFREAVRSHRLLVTFNGINFDLPFIEKHFRDANFRFEQPHLDLLLLARSMGLSGGLKDMEKQLGIGRADDIKEVRGNLAVQLWNQWRAGDAAAYKRLVAYCKADCVNLAAFADQLYRRRWEQVYTAHARPVDFARIKGQQLSIFG